MSFDGCTYVDPTSGAPCLKVRGHDDIKGEWKCSYCGPAEGRAEWFKCACGFGAQAPSQHLTMTGWDGRAVTKIVPLEEFNKQYERDTKLGPTPIYSTSALDGVIIRGVKHEDSCASKKAPPGRLLTGEYACDCKEGHVTTNSNDPYLGRETLVVPNADAGKVQCPECRVNHDAADEDGMVTSGDFECPDCGALYEITDVVVRATITWRKRL